MEATKSTDVIKSLANKDLYSMQELCHNIGKLLKQLWMILMLVVVWN